MGVSVHTQGRSPRKWEGLCPDAVLEQVKGGGGSLRREMIVPEPTKDRSLGIGRRASGDRHVPHARGILPWFAVAGITNRAPTRPPILPCTAQAAPAEEHGTAGLSPLRALGCALTCCPTWASPHLADGQSSHYGSHWTEE